MNKIKRKYRDSRPDPIITFKRYRITGNGDSYLTNNQNEIDDAKEAGYDVKEEKE